MTSTNAKPLWEIAAFRMGTSWALSPEKLRATNVAPSDNASRHPSIACIVLASPFLLNEPASADAENCPLVSP